jgi:hypothetical protein
MDQSRSSTFRVPEIPVFPSPVARKSRSQTRENITEKRTARCAFLRIPFCRWQAYLLSIGANDDANETAIFSAPPPEMKFRSTRQRP